ncbi:MAG: CotH kinase family protein [Prevotellaceae bacterium]|nr:CotH kinase family protein [Prevotellaceae bacterium]
MKKNLLLCLAAVCMTTACRHDEVKDIPPNPPDSELFSPKGIAEIRIRLLNDKSIDDIKNDNDASYSGKMEAEIVIQNSAHSDYDGGQLYTGRILIEGRGYSSWDLPKKSYNIDLKTADGSDNPSPLLDMPACDEWCLQTFGFDRSLMRIPLAMYLGQRTKGIEWTPRTKYAELWVNDEYRGLYTLTEKILRDKNRINIEPLNSSPDNLSGGYILEENTKTLSTLEREKQFFTGIGQVPIGFKYPKAKNVTDAQREWIMNYMREFETVLWNDDVFKDPIEGYQKYIDKESFIDWTILIEHSADIDHAGNISNYLHKDKDRTLKMSAPWDFDRAYGNETAAIEGNYVRIVHWYGRLAQDEAYLTQYKARMRELKPLFDRIPDIIDANLAQLQAAGVMEREAQRWAELPSWTGCETREEEIQFLKHWIQGRTEWCYKEIGIY